MGGELSGEEWRDAGRLRDLYGGEARFLRADLSGVPLADSRVVVASSAAAYQMVVHLEGALGEAHRVLREDGVLVLSVPHPLYELLDLETGEFRWSYFDTGRREITIDEEYESVLVAFDRTVADLHNALVDAGFEVRRLLETKHREARENDPADGDLPDLLWTVPRSVRFWAVAR